MLTLRTLYEAYPDHDLLACRAPMVGETYRSYRGEVERCGDTLFLFLARELCQENLELEEAIRRLDRAMADIQTVRRSIAPKLRRENSLPEK